MSADTTPVAKITLMYALPDEFRGLDSAPVIFLMDLPRTPAEVSRLRRALGLDTMNDAQLKAVDDQYGLGGAYHFPYDLIDTAMPEALTMEDGDGRASPTAIVALGPALGDGEGEAFTVEAKVVAVIVPKAAAIGKPSGRRLAMP